MSGINHPDAAEFVSRSAALRDCEAVAAGKSAGSFYWGITDPWDRISFGKRRLSQDCLDRLRSLWEPEDNEPHLRFNAFSLWLTGTEEGDLPVLRRIGPPSPLFKAALSRRKKLGDRTAAAEIPRCLATEKYPDYCWVDGDRIWGDDLKPVLDSYLGGLAESIGDHDFEDLHHVSAELLRAIPASDAEPLLLKHWPHLKRSVSFVQSALTIATPACLAAVAEAISEYPDPRKPFEHVEHALGIRYTDREARVSERHLEALRPYLDLLSDHTIEMLWFFCNNRRFFSWRRKYLDPLLSPEPRGKLGLEDAALFSELDRYAEDEPWANMNHWLELFDRRGDPPDRWKRILTGWLQERKSLAALKVASYCLILRGERKDFSLLEAAGLSTEDSQIATMIEDTRFALFRRTLE
jgi:hypothetical protein